MRTLTSLARRSVLPVYACIGPGMLAATERLLAQPGLRRVSSPREAMVLLEAGEIPATDRPALDRIHDQLPHPRATLHWDGTEGACDRLFALRDELLEGRGSSPDRQDDRPPNEWVGLGDHGQGGQGMMGGTPYGRPMAMPDDDIRDGLQLGAYTATFGPFAPMMPPGLALSVTLQGDVIVSAEVAGRPYPQDPEADAPALCAARMLRLMGLDRAAARVASGRGAGALGLRAALPAGLGGSGGSDARGRLTVWLAGKEARAPASPVPELLPGLEWHEAMLVLNSFAPSALREACPAPESEDHAGDEETEAA